MNLVKGILSGASLFILTQSITSFALTPYVGAGLSYNILRNNVSSVSNSVIAGTNVANSSEDSPNTIYRNKVSGRIFLGADFFKQQQFELDGEVGFNTNHIRTSDINLAIEIGTGTFADQYYATLKSAFDLSLNPGYWVTQQLEVYGIIGYSRASYDDYFNSTFISPAGVQQSLQMMGSGHVNGVRYGGGVKWLINQNWQARLNVTNTQYQNITNTGVTTYTNVAPAITTTANQTYRLNNLATTLSVVYQLGNILTS